MTAMGENTRVKLDYIDSVIFIIHDNNKYDIILGGNSRTYSGRGFRTFYYTTMVSHKLFFFLSV